MTSLLTRLRSGWLLPAVLSTTALRVAAENLESTVALGFGKENASALIKALEKEASIEVKARAAI